MLRIVSHRPGPYEEDDASAVEWTVHRDNDSVFGTDEVHISTFESNELFYGTFGSVAFY